MKINPDTAARIRALHQEGMNYPSIATKLDLSRVTVRHVLHGELTKLEARTNRLYARCQEKGGCVPSGVYVVRPFPNGDRMLSVCRRCSVPINGESWRLVLRSKARMRGADARRRAA